MKWINLSLRRGDIGWVEEDGGFRLMPPSVVGDLALIRSPVIPDDMPYKLLVNLKSNPHQSSVLIQEDGLPPVQLKYVKRVVITGDAEGPPMVELTMDSPHFDGEVVISDATAEAVMQHEKARQLSFIGGAEALALVQMREELRIDWEGVEAQDELAAFDKIIAVLVKRDEIV